MGKDLQWFCGRGWLLFFDHEVRKRAGPPSPVDFHYFIRHFIISRSAFSFNRLNVITFLAGVKTSFGRSIQLQIKIRIKCEWHKNLVPFHMKYSPIQNKFCHLNGRLLLSPLYNSWWTYNTTTLMTFTLELSLLHSKSNSLFKYIQRYCFM